MSEYEGKHRSSVELIYRQPDESYVPRHRAPVDGEIYDVGSTLAALVNAES